MNEAKPEEKFSSYTILGRYVLTSSIFAILENTPGHGGNQPTG